MPRSVDCIDVRMRPHTLSVPALFPALVPIPHALARVFRQRHAERARLHADLSAVMGFVRDHVARESHDVEHEHVSTPRDRTRPTLKSSVAILRDLAEM